MEDMQSLFKERRLLYMSASVLLGLLSILIVVAIIGSFLGLSYFDKAAKGENVITVSGEAEVFAVPDIAKIWLTVETEKETVDAAQTEATEKINNILAFLEGEGIEEKDIKTQNYSVYPRYDYVERAVNCVSYPCPPQGEQVLRGYRVNQSLEIKVRDTEKVGALLAGAGELGVTNINGPFFENDDEEALRLDARKEAIVNAREKAEELAKSLDVKLGDIVSFNEGGSYPVHRGDFAIAEESAVMGKGGAAPAPEIPTGENVIRATVTISYELK